LPCQQYRHWKRLALTEKIARKKKTSDGAFLNVPRFEDVVGEPE
jgi:hypothetical protein